MSEFTEALGLDVGGRRIGVARVGSVARLPEPVTTVINEDGVLDVIDELVDEFSSDVVVVGLPRSLDGNDTDQTLISREFAATLEASGKRVVLQDEALSSKKADDLIQQGVYKRNARGDDVTTDEVAACIILEDFLGGPNSV